MKPYVTIAADDFEKMKKSFGMHAVIEYGLNFQQELWCGMVLLGRTRDIDSLVGKAKGMGFRAGAFKTEEGAKRGLRRILNLDGTSD